jgi:peptidoglycan/xylan/chitin deacetylase (PgdA/CDA1 family)
MRVAVLTYHSHRVAGNDYRDNDHVALREDFRRVIRAGLPVVSLLQVARALVGMDILPPKALAFSFDDGMDSDFLDLVDPVYGEQQSFCRIVTSVLAEQGLKACPPATAFVIADPQARLEMDRVCLQGLGRVSDNWWLSAVRSGRLLVANHSWDHGHPDLARYRDVADGQRRFLGVTDYAQADLQIRRAGEFIARVAGNPGLALFAYPFGHFTDYLAREYLPGFQQEHGLLAAFTTAPGAVHAQSDRWLLPRYVSGADWKSPEGLEAILRCL